MEKTAVITGASRGIGAACALRFGAAGYRVAVWCHTQREAAQCVVQRITEAGGTAQAFCGDVADARDVQAVFAAVQERFGGADVLINNAGVAQQKLFTDVTQEDWRAVVGTALDGTALCCQAALPHMIHQKWGRIVNIASMWGQTGASCEAHYSAAKAGVIGLTKALAKEEGPSGITVNCIAPGVIDTDMMAAFSMEDRAALVDETPLGRLGTPDDVAAAAFFLAGDEASFITGQVLGVNGGFYL